MTSATINSTAVDAFVDIDVIQVVGRHRKDLGDIASLAASVNDVGLLNPITLTRTGRLIAGQRRLEACRFLGWGAVPVRFVDNFGDAVTLLRAELHENSCRKDMLPSELASLGAALYELEVRSSRARQGARTDLGREPLGTAYPQVERTNDAVGETLGMSGRAYSELRYVHQIATSQDAEARDLAEKALNAMDQGAGLVGEARRLREKLRAHEEEDSPATAPPAADPEALYAARGAAGSADPPTQIGSESERNADWIPAPTDKSRAAVERRHDLIRELAPRGYSSHQIGEQIGLQAESVRRIARDGGIELPADRAMGRNTTKTIDSNRIVRVTIQNLADAEMALGLVNYNDLDATELPALATSLTKSIRVLTELNKRMREIVRDQHQA